MLPPGTVTDEGTLTLRLLSLTCNDWPPEGAGADSATVHCAAEPPITGFGAHCSEDTVGAAGGCSVRLTAFETPL